MRALVKFCALLLVAGLTSVIDGVLGEQAIRRILFHRVVAIRAAELVIGVNRTGPMQSITASVAGHALPVLLLDRRAPTFGKTNQKIFIFRVFSMFRTGAVTRFADLFFFFSFWI